MVSKNEYFSHDYHARSDLRVIQMAHGLEGVGLYWCFVEILHENGGAVAESELEGIAFELHTTPELCRSIVYDSGKFVIENGLITSRRVQRNLEKRKQVSEARRAAAGARWEEGDGDGLPVGTLFDEVPPDEEPQNVNARGEAPEIVERHKAFIAERLDAFERDGTLDHPVWGCRGKVESLIEAVLQSPDIRVSGKVISPGECLHTLQYYVRDRGTLEEFEKIFATASEKATRGEIGNKQNYLIAALYQAAKLNGW